MGTEEDIETRSTGTPVTNLFRGSQADEPKILSGIPSSYTWQTPERRFNEGEMLFSVSFFPLFTLPAHNHLWSF